MVRRSPELGICLRPPTHGLSEVGVCILATRWQSGDTSSDRNSDLLGEVLWRSPLFLSSHTRVLVLVPPRAIRKQKNKMVPLYLIMWS